MHAACFLENNRLLDIRVAYYAVDHVDCPLCSLSTAGYFAIVLFFN